MDRPGMPRKVVAVAEKGLYQLLAVIPLGPPSPALGVGYNYRGVDFGSGAGTALGAVGLASFPCG